MERVELAFRAMGSPCQVKLYARTRALAQAAVDEVQREVQRLEQKYSRYRDDSLTARINRSAGDAAGVEVDDETAGLLDYAAIAHRESGGLFDITSGVLRRAWDFRSGKLPAQAQLDALLPKVGWQRVRWQRPRLVLPLAGMELDFGGYVKEYAADAAAARARALGVAHGLVDLGGDVCLLGPHPDGQPWRVGIRDPQREDAAIATLDLDRGAIATSGDYERCMVVDGRRYSHLLDPRTGWPVTSLASVSVVAAQCLVAGTSTTVALLMGPERGAEWLDALGLPNLRIAHDGRLGGSLAAAAVAALE
ncbi:MAG TPA: FAD:protein FMN transferase, partial [Solimonas sp.]|nr:FAD:protein FMN transferase [Solimonas sp.]